MIGQVKEEPPANLVVPVKQVRTDRLRPLAWALVLFISSVMGLIVGISSLKQYLPPKFPIIDQFFTTKGRHLWIVKEQDGSCRGVIAGGWKKKKGPGDRVGFAFKFKPIATENFEDIITGNIKADFSDYRNLEKLVGNVNGSSIQFDGKYWSGINNPPKDSILLIEGSKQTRIIRFAAIDARLVEKELSALLQNPDLIDEVDAKTYKSCLGSIHSTKIGSR